MWYPSLLKNKAKPSLVIKHSWTGWVGGSYWPHLQQAIADWSTYALVQVGSNSLCRLGRHIYTWGTTIIQKLFFGIFSFQTILKKKRIFLKIYWSGMNLMPGLYHSNTGSVEHTEFMKNCCVRENQYYLMHINAKKMSLTQPAPRPLKMFYPTWTQLLFRQGNPPIIASLPATQRVQEFLITRGETIS